MNRNDMMRVVGGLTQTTKMPCHSFSIPTSACKKGSKLRKVEGSVCHHCYAHDRGNYSWPNVKNAQARRLRILNEVITSGEGSGEWQLWVDTMVQLMSRETYFRWHDSGDLQSMEHLKLIVAVCKRTPHVMHRMPTKEFKTIRRYVQTVCKLPDNLIVQLSSPMLNDRIKVSHERWADGMQVATTYTNAAAAYADGVKFVCPATVDRKTCGDCRACWDPTITNIAYMLH